jgi:hypothetical protein
MMPNLEYVLEKSQSRNCNKKAARSKHHTS